MSNPLLLNVLIQDLISPNELSQKQASELLRLLTQSNVDHRTFIAKNELAMKALIHIISRDSCSTTNQVAIAEHAIAILFHLLLNEDLILHLGSLGVVKPITQNLVRTAPSIATRENAAGALLCLAKLDVHKAPIGIYGGITGLLSLMPTCSEEGKQDALKALLLLLAYDGNKTLAARGGAAILLFDMFINTGSSHSQSNEQASELALSVLRIMASHSEGISAIAVASGVKRIAAAITDMTSTTCKEKAALALLRIFKTEPSLMRHLENERHSHDHALFSSLNDLSIHGSRKGRRAATLLLKLFMDREVGDHNLGQSMEFTKEQDEQEEEDGEELAEVGAERPRPMSYDEICYSKHRIPVKFSKEGMLDANCVDDEIENIDDDELEYDSGGDTVNDNLGMEYITYVDNDNDNDYCRDSDSDDAYSVPSTPCIEVPLAH
ncbi:hypothetical protein L7F22_009874 [Adiantum nelumboides]|nr:hypothetical protein [Adiantum nelumboides]